MSSNQNLILALKQERLETAIAIYASMTVQLDESEERQLRNALVVSRPVCQRPGLLTNQQVEFLDDAHSYQFAKSRYIRHVANIIGVAIEAETFVPWAQVHAKAGLRGTQSNLSMRQ